jgi:S-adenosylmethionine synthetase
MIRTAECVSPKHPDKMCDRISDTLLDLYLTQDQNSRCAIEVCGGNKKVFITGEVTSEAVVTESDIRTVVHNISGVKDVIIHLNSQSPEIANGVDTGGAGDQGIMIGYACRDNEQYIPQEYYLSRELNKFIYFHYPYDGKTQVTISGTSLSVVCSFQNAPSEMLEGMVKGFFSRFPQYEIEDLHCNPAGDWNIGGFEADAGLTGRKLAVDNYGPRVPIGGGAFSGKDSTKVDRSGAYMARRIAVDILEERPSVKEVTVQLAYAIGYNQPLQASAIVDGKHEVIKGYDLSPKGIIDFLELKQPIFGDTAAFGHMGAGFKWK